MSITIIGGGGGGGGASYDQSLNTTDSVEFGTVSVGDIYFDSTSLYVQSTPPGHYTELTQGSLLVHSPDSEASLTPAGLVLANNTQVTVGSFDTAIGGSGGISLVCVVGYELNWQAGYLRCVNTDGSTRQIWCESAIEFPGNGADNVQIDAAGVTFADGSQQYSAWTGSVDWTAITNAPSLATVATSGSYTDLSNAPSLATVATSGSYTDLSNTPSLDFAAASHSHVATTDITAGNWKVLYSDGSGAMVELGLGASGTVLQSNGDSAAPTWEVVSGGGGGVSSWNDLTDKPTEFTPSAHTHGWSDITDKPTEFTPSAHSHTTQDLPVVLEKTVDLGNSGTSKALSLEAGSFQTCALTDNCTFTMPTAQVGAVLTLVLKQTLAFTASFTGVLWSGGTAPTMTALADKRDIFVFMSDGTNWYGTASQNF